MSVRSAQRHSGFLDLLVPVLVVASYFALTRFATGSDTNPSEWVIETRTLISQKKFEDALTYNARLLELFPKNHVYLMQAATLLKELGRSEDEAKALEEFILVAPDPGEACPLLVESYRRVNAKEKMVDAATRCLSLEPKNSDFRFNLAISYERASQPEKALELFSEGAKTFPSYTDFAIGRARMLLRTGDPQTAYQEITQVLEQKPGLADAQLVAALSAIRLEKWEEARATLETAIKDHPQYQELQDAMKEVTEHEQKNAR